MWGKKKIKAFVFLLLWCVIYSAQNSSRVYKLDNLLPLLSKKFNVVFSYDVDLVKGVPVSHDTSLTNITSVIKELNDNSAFHFSTSDKKNILVRPLTVKGNFILCGKIIDTKTKEPLIGAYIYQTKGKYVLVADENGSFYQAIHFEESDSILISTVGYHQRRVSLSGFTSNACAEIGLENQFSEIKEVTVTAYLTQGISYDAMDNSITVRPRNLSILPGQTNGDLLSSLDALPGISSPDTKAGNINVRGSTPDQTLIVFDNIPIYHKGHYFGTLSPFNSRVVDHIKVQRGTMSANDGGRVGGMIEISTANSVANKFTGSVSTSLLDASMYIHTPLVKDKLSLLVSARQSYPYSFDSPTLQSLSDFVFQITEVSPLLTGAPGQDLRFLKFNYRDGNAKLIANLSEKHKASLSFLYVYNDMLLSFSRAKGNLISDTVKVFNWGVNASINSKWTEKFSTDVSVTNSYYEQGFKEMIQYSFGYVGNTLCRNTAKDFRTLLQTNWKISEKYELKSGYDLRYHDMRYDKLVDDTASTLHELRINGVGTVHTVYANLLAVPTERLLVNAGIRANYFTVTSRPSFEPRISLGYKLNDHFRLKSSAGYQQQFVSQISGVSVESIGGIENLLWILADENKVPVINCVQSTFGGMFQKKSWLIDLEGYYKNITNVSFVNINGTKPPFMEGTIATFGADLLVRKQWKHVDAWVSYTISKSTMQFDSVQADPFLSLYDQTHVLDIACSYKLRQWKFSASWKYRTGLAALPEIRNRMLAGEDSQPNQQATPPPPPPPPPGGPPPPHPEEPALPEGVYTNRFPDNHQLDVSLAYTFPKTPKKWNGSVGFSALNVYDQKNIIGQVIVQQAQGQSEVRDRYSLGFMPNIFLTFSW